MEILQLWELQSANVQVERNLSNILFIIYVIAYFIKREGCYVIAFLFDETLSNLSCMDVLAGHQYYLMISLDIIKINLDRNWPKSTAFAYFSNFFKKVYPLR